ncbi:MAG: DinB family protein [Anaerolineales bacterium]|nr:DinB family protein [Anaerolineales bacterium]
MATYNHNLSTLIRFNFWANGRLLTACEQLPADAFTRDVTPDPGWGSLRGILVHILDAEYGWRMVLQELDADVILKTADFADVAALKARWNRERAAWFDYAASLSEDSLDTASSTGLTVWQTILHVVTHGSQHRGEAALILTAYGQSPGELDFDLFLQENTETQDWSNL